jgi:cell division protein FtsB
MLSDNDEIAALKNQVFTLLVALIVVSGTLTIYLYRQVSLENKDIAQAERASAELTTNDEAIVTLVQRLEAYGQKNPDFQKTVLKKYNISPGPAPKK